jgi:hypothetical protein
LEVDSAVDGTWTVADVNVKEVEESGTVFVQGWRTLVLPYVIHAVTVAVPAVVEASQSWEAGKPVKTSAPVMKSWVRGYE